MATDEFDPWSMSIFTSSPFTFAFAVCNMVRGDDALPSMFDKLMYIVSVSSDPFWDAFSEAKSTGKRARSRKSQIFNKLMKHWQGQQKSRFLF